MGGGVGHVQAVEEGAQQKNQFHIRVGCRYTENLRIDLVKLTVTAFLGAFPAKHGTDGIEFPDRILGVHLVLDVGPADGCRGLRPQGQLLSFSVRKGVHLFFDDVRVLADTAREQLGLFHDGNADFPVPEIFEQGDGGAFDMLPQLGFTGKDILKPSDQLNVWLAHG
jgi:hypothetical protein